MIEAVGAPSGTSTAVTADDHVALPAASPPVATTEEQHFSVVATGGDAARRRGTTDQQDRYNLAASPGPPAARESTAPRSSYDLDERPRARPPREQVLSRDAFRSAEQSFSQLRVHTQERCRGGQQRSEETISRSRAAQHYALGRERDRSRSVERRSVEKKLPSKPAWRGNGGMNSKLVAREMRERREKQLHLAERERERTHRQRERSAERAQRQRELERELRKLKEQGSGGTSTMNGGNGHKKNSAGATKQRPIAIDEEAGPAGADFAPVGEYVSDERGGGPRRQGWSDRGGGERAVLGRNRGDTTLTAGDEVDVFRPPPRGTSVGEDSSQVIREVFRDSNGDVVEVIRHSRGGRVDHDGPRVRNDVVAAELRGDAQAREQVLQQQPVFQHDPAHDVDTRTSRQMQWTFGSSPVSTIHGTNSYISSPTLISSPGGTSPSQMQPSAHLRWDRTALQHQQPYPQAQPLLQVRVGSLRLRFMVYFHHSFSFYNSSINFLAKLLSCRRG